VESPLAAAKAVPVVAPSLPAVAVAVARKDPQAVKEESKNGKGTPLPIFNLQSWVRN